jgi:hypothetical protein
MRRRFGATKNFAASLPGDLFNAPTCGPYVGCARSSPQLPHPASSLFFQGLGAAMASRLPYPRSHDPRPTTHDHRRHRTTTPPPCPSRLPPNSPCWRRRPAPASSRSHCSPPPSRIPLPRAAATAARQVLRSSSGPRRRRAPNMYAHPSLPFVLCETEHPNPGYICIQIWSNFKDIRGTYARPMSFTGSFTGSAPATLMRYWSWSAQSARPAQAGWRPR